MFGLFGVFENCIERFDAEQPSKRHSIDARLIGSLGFHPIGFLSKAYVTQTPPEVGLGIHSSTDNAGKRQ
jgi:hypothetical protein